MGFLLTLLAILAIIALFVGLGEYSSARPIERMDKMLSSICAVGIIGGLVASIIVGIFMLISYINYVDMKQDYVIMEQYAAEVRAYARYGVGTFVPGQMVGKEITDFKFGSYQEELSDKLHYLRSTVESYNNTLVGKQIMKQSWYWGWVIHLPDEDLKTVSLGKLLNNMEEGKDAVEDGHNGDEHRGNTHGEGTGVEPGGNTQGA